MNIQSLIEKINLFEELVVLSGFKRDVFDFIQAIQQNQNKNLVFMKDLSSKVKNKFYEFENFGIDKDLKILLKDSDPFTELTVIQDLENIDNNVEIDSNNYFSTFYNALNKLHQQIEKNKNELDTLNAVLQKYVSKENIISSKETAIISIIFRDHKTIRSLSSFSKVINRWNSTLLMYHTLIKSESPKEIELVEIQNGSIDVICNIDFDLALDLTEVIKTGMKVYGAFLLYKTSKAKEIIDTYYGNKKLINQEKEREKLMLENIRESIKNKILEQYNKNIINDSKIDPTSYNKKIEEISNVIADHIIHGNELKLLTQYDPENSDNDISKELRKVTAATREAYKNLNPEDKLLLIEKFTFKDEEKD